MSVYFCADSHHGHGGKDGKGGIIRMANRPFANVEEMDETLIANWNARIRTDSVVYYGGDFAHRCSAEQLQRIWRRLTKPKMIHLVRGNHDGLETLALPWTSVSETLVQVSFSNRRFVLFHYAMRTWPGLHRGAIHLFGHSHNKLPSYANALDIGVDAWNYAPVSVEEIIARAETLPHSPDAEPDATE